MSELFTREQIAQDYNLWLAHFDIYGQMPKAIFDSLPIDYKVKLQAEGYDAMSYRVE